MPTSWNGAGSGGLISSVFGRIGVVIAQIGDYAASLITNDSDVAGDTVEDALNTLSAAIPREAFSANWGAVAAPAAAQQRFIARTNASVAFTTTPSSEYPVTKSGTFAFTLTWRISGNKLATNSIIVEVFRNGVATGLLVNLPPAGADSGQVSASLPVSLGDGISIGLLQSGTESSTQWNLNVALRGVTP